MPWTERWTRLAGPGGGVESSPIAVSWGPGRIDVFARGENNTLHYTPYERSWGNSQFLSLGRNLVSNFSPSAVSWYTGRLDVFALGRDSSGSTILQHTWRQDNGPWINWEPSGGSNLDPASVPAALSWDFGRLDVFVLGTDGKIHHIWYFDGWRNWERLGENEPLGTGFTSAPHAVSWGNGRLNVFAKDRVNRIVHKWHGGGRWGNWDPLGQDVFVRGPHAVSWGNGRLDVFALGADSTVYTKSYYSPGGFLRLHAKILDPSWLSTPPITPLAQTLQSMRQVFATAGISVDIITQETLNLPLSTDIRVGDCIHQWGPFFGTTNEQNQLFNNRNNVREKDIVIYFVRSTIPPANGCATHLDGKPGCVVAMGATQWTFPHEIGHVLGLGHVNNNDRLMTGNGTSNITNPPPDLINEEIRTMNSSTLVHRAR